MPAHLLIVASQYFDVHARIGHRADRHPGRGLWRVEEHSEAREHEISLIGHRRRLLPVIHPPAGDPEGTEALVSEVRQRRRKRLACFGVQRQLLSGFLIIAGHTQHVLWCPLHDQPPRPLMLDQDRNAAPLEIEWHLVNFAPGRHVERPGRDNRFIERTLHPALKSAVDAGLGIGTLARRAVPIDGTNKLDRSLGQRARLVGAQHVHRTQIVDGRKAFDDHPVLRQLQGGAGERHRDNHR